MLLSWKSFTSKQQRFIFPLFHSSITTVFVSAHSGGGGGGVGNPSTFEKSIRPLSGKWQVSLVSCFIFVCVATHRSRPARFSKSAKNSKMFYGSSLTRQRCVLLLRTLFYPYLQFYSQTNVNITLPMTQGHCCTSYCHATAMWVKPAVPTLGQPPIKRHRWGRC